VSGVVSDEQRRSWNDDGWCILERAVPAEDLVAAQSAASKLFPDAEKMATSSDTEQDERWRTWDASWPEFPFRSRSLNRLVLSDTMIELAQELLGADDVRLYLAIVTAKYASQPSEYNQLLHTDFPNHTLTVPRPEPGYHQMETFIYLNDVGPNNGATRFVSRTRTSHIPVGEHTLNFIDHGDLYDDPGVASAPAGSIVAYRPDVYHRSVDFTEPTQARFMLHVSYKPASLEWHNFVQQATPRQLTALGFPAPGHAFWTDETLSGVASRYPELDLTPWRAARPDAR
jgi:hypothetical protein